MNAAEEKDEIGEQLKRFASKYKNVSNQELRFLVNDHLVPLLEDLREEYTDMFMEGAEDEDDEDDEAVELAEAGMNTLAALGLVLDALTEAGKGVPAELQAQYDAARGLVADFSSKAQAVLDDVVDDDGDEGDDE